MTPEVILTPQVPVELKPDSQLPKFGELVPFRINGFNLVFYEPFEALAGFRDKLCFGLRISTNFCGVFPFGQETSVEEVNPRTGFFVFVEDLFKAIKEEKKVSEPFGLRFEASEEGDLTLKLSGKSSVEPWLFDDLYEFLGENIIPVEGERKKNYTLKAKGFAVIPILKSDKRAILVTTLEELQEKNLWVTAFLMDKGKKAYQ